MKNCVKLVITKKKILSFIYPIYNRNWRNISTIYIHKKTSIKRNILTIKQNTSGSRSGEGLISTSVPGWSALFFKSDAVKGGGRGRQGSSVKEFSGCVGIQFQQIHSHISFWRVIRLIIWLSALRRPVLDLRFL